ncbi:hypothetical protein TELCIR_11193 [Teladorsagia circumcincta]|uniref:Emp24/gp25L/p24 family protein n=1 Tax=Teladorsagia circumcincta TaxID=45464 RepID=A0A2G9UBF2_TELCI|nr:hypothetical protein TELCIR_11193 [Teladorsagia circumcincta]
MLSLILALVLPVLVSSKLIQLTVRENFTQPCPNVKSDLIDRSSLRFSFDMVPNEDEEEDEGDKVVLTDMNGETRTISFPGCYRVKLSFKMRQPIQNPSFCHLCDTVKEEGNKRSSELRQYVLNEGSEKCDTQQDRQTLYFKMCTPSRRELNERHGDARDKMEEYWNYLKQGVLTAVVHVMDRSDLDENRRQQCQKMCHTYTSKRGVSFSYRNTLLKSIESLCTPRDDYAAYYRNTTSLEEHLVICKVY